jgi:hypothetical protein
MKFIDPTKPYRKSGGWGPPRGLVVLSAEEKQDLLSRLLVLMRNPLLASSRIEP